jgi:hypothetical protein
LDASAFLLLRDIHKARPLESIGPGRTVVHHQNALSDAFKQTEYGVLAIEMGAAMVVTPTCDLDDLESWQVCPVFEFGNDDPRKQRVFRFDFQDRFPLPRHPKGDFEDAFVDLADSRSVPKAMIVSGYRTAALATVYQSKLAEHIAKLFGRFWGFSEDETAPQDGLYRCMRDLMFFDLKAGDQQPVSMKKGQQFPPCPNCERIRKKAQYVLLTKHKRY